jgi:hypothetical protein
MLRILTKGFSHSIPYFWRIAIDLNTELDSIKFCQLLHPG